MSLHIPRGGSAPVTSLRLHGDTLVEQGDLDFAVNVWPGDRPPGLQRALSEALERHRYPDEDGARTAVAARHGRDRTEVLLTNGACEAFWLLAHALRPPRAACVHPGFTEPEAALRAVGTEVVRVFREPHDWRLDPAAVPTDVDMVVIGNPDNPTGRLEVTEALARPDRLLVVDESFIDFVPGERESLARRSDVVVIRSLTKLWSLAGVRAGYLLGPASLVSHLGANRQPWSVNALACAALAFCGSDVETAKRVRATVARERSYLEQGLSTLGLQWWPSQANFILIKARRDQNLAVRLHERGIAVRPCSSFPGLDDHYIRVAVRGHADNERLLDVVGDVLS